MTRRLVSGMLVLGWIPTLMVAGSFRWLVSEGVTAQERTPIKVTRIYTGDDGKTHAEELDVPLGQPRGATSYRSLFLSRVSSSVGRHQTTSSTGTRRRAAST